LSLSDFFWSLSNRSMKISWHCEQNNEMDAYVYLAGLSALSSERVSYASRSLPCLLNVFRIVNDGLFIFIFAIDRVASGFRLTIGVSEL